jgi:hypothetical protein
MGDSEEGVVFEGSWGVGWSWGEPVSSLRYPRPRGRDGVQVEISQEFALCGKG